MFGPQHYEKKVVCKKPPDMIADTDSSTQIHTDFDFSSGPGDPGGIPQRIPQEIPRIPQRIPQGIPRGTPWGPPGSAFGSRPPCFGPQI